MAITRLGKYELHEQLGRGGFGTVYRATDTMLGRDVALKMLHPQLTVDMDFIQRFRNEAQRIAAFEHPNIVAIHSVGEEDGRLYIDMQYLPGGSLGGRLKREGVFPFDEALRIIKDVSAGLQVAHAKGLIHRDIKPENILFAEDGHAVVSDFGLAKDIQSSAVSTSSSLGGVGTPAYRAPEVWRGKPPASAVTDEYSLACVLTEMLNGKQLFSGDTPDEIITKHLVDGAALPEKWAIGIPAGMSKILGKALDKDPAKRYADVTGYINALEGLGTINDKRETEILHPTPSAGKKSSSIVKPRVSASARNMVRRPPPHGEVPPEPLGAIWRGWIVWIGAGLLLATIVLFPWHSKTPTVLPTRTDTAIPASTAETPQTVTAIQAATRSHSRIAFVSDRDGNDEIYVMNADGSGQTNLTNNPAGDVSPTWSADGKKIAFESNRDGNNEIYFMNADGNGQSNLTNNPAWDGSPTWSPDGKKIAFESNRDGNFEIYVMNADASGQTNLTNNPNGDISPTWSLDGKMIAIESNRDGNNEIYVMNADGSGQTNLTNNPADDGPPIWSPNGKKIAFESKRDGNNDIYVMNADGSGQTNLTNNPADDGPPIWSPNGKKIAFESKRDGINDIYVMNADGSGQTNLTINPVWDKSPSWSIDGMKIAFDSRRDGNFEIYVMSADGSGQTNLTNNPADDGSPVWSPQ